MTSRIEALKLVAKAARLSQPWHLMPDDLKAAITYVEGLAAWSEGTNKNVVSVLTLAREVLEKRDILIVDYVDLHDLADRVGDVVDDDLIDPEKLKARAEAAILRMTEEADITIVDELVQEIVDKWSTPDV